MATVNDIAERYFAELTTLSPNVGTFLGLGEPTAELTDYSPASIAARTELVHRTLADLEAVDAGGTRDDRLAKAFMQERLQTDLESKEAGDELRRISNLWSYYSETRQVFDLSPVATEADWELIAGRMENVPGALRSAQAALEEGIRGGVVASRRQAEAVAHQLATWAGETPGERPWFNGFVARAPEDVTRSALGARLEAAAGLATDALREAQRYMSGTYLAAATPSSRIRSFSTTRRLLRFLGMMAICNRWSRSSSKP